jgi:hypothetical protein
MPHFPINEQTAQYLAPNVPGQGQSVLGFWPPQTPLYGGPALMLRWDIESVYIPVAVAVFNSGAGTPPTVCHLTLQLWLSGELVWQNSQDVSLLAYTPSPGWVIGNAPFADSMPNPIGYRNGQGLQIGYMAQLDQAVNPAIGQGAFYLILAAMYTPALPGGTTSVPGSIGYREVLEDSLVLA